MILLLLCSLLGGVFLSVSPIVFETPAAFFSAVSPRARKRSSFLCAEDVSGEGLGLGDMSLQPLKTEMRRNGRRQMRVTLGSACLVGAAVLAVAAVPGISRWLELPWPSWLLGLSGAWLAWRGLRERVDDED